MKQEGPQLECLSVSPGTSFTKGLIHRLGAQEQFTFTPLLRWCQHFQLYSVTFLDKSQRYANLEWRSPLQIICFFDQSFLEMKAQRRTAPQRREHGQKRHHPERESFPRTASSQGLLDKSLRERRRSQRDRDRKWESASGMVGDTLKHFVLHSEAVKLFRNFARTAKRLPTK
jgi:hypothetical protein